jgi:UDP-N-acetylglucosamine--N-acetylmuramyl-(pentapeptide) pyrophosphoryl-undecaprenol N-acetylglucosamine transferase
MPHLLIAASGTGGHIFPALAVAERLSDCRITWLGVPDRLETQLVGSLYDLKTIQMSGLQGRPGLSWLNAMSQFARSVWAVRQLLQQGQFAGVFTTGGYIAAPAILAALSLSLPVILHESNAIPGKVTRWLAPLCTMVALGMSEAAAQLPKVATQLVGNPVRTAFGTPQPLALPIPADVPLIAVTGGSQGARGLNRLVVEAAPTWLDAGAWIVHLTGELDAADVEAIAPQHPHYLRFPFWTEMAALLQRATFAISRSGAMTLADLAATQTPSILVPYPYAAEDHQYANAIAFANRGAAVVRREANLTAPQLAALGLDWLHHPEIVAEMRSCLATEATHAASDAIANLIRQSFRIEHLSQR